MEKIVLNATSDTYKVSLVSNFSDFSSYVSTFSSLNVVLVFTVGDPNIGAVRYTSTTQSMLGRHLPKVTLVGNLFAVI